MPSARRRFAGLAGLLLAAALANPAAAQKKKPPAHPLDLNRATAAQLEQVPGVGPSTAQAIVRFRSRSGPFRSVDDLLALQGIGRKRLARMRPYLTVEQETPGERRKAGSEKKRRPETKKGKPAPTAPRRVPQ
jgi:competence ComEA-like helix-hairpin-helix protein